MYIIQILFCSLQWSLQDRYYLSSLYLNSVNKYNVHILTGIWFCCNLTLLSVCPAWKEAFGCWPDSTKSLCKKTCGFCKRTWPWTPGNFCTFFGRLYYIRQSCLYDDVLFYDNKTCPCLVRWICEIWTIRTKVWILPITAKDFITHSSPAVPPPPTSGAPPWSWRWTSGTSALPAETTVANGHTSLNHIHQSYSLLVENL